MFSYINLSYYHYMHCITVPLKSVNERLFHCGSRVVHALSEVAFWLLSL